MTIKEIYDAFDKIGCLSFTTINEFNDPISRIAHLRAYDEHGLYFMTMFTKPFFKQLHTNKKISLCGLCTPDKEIHHDENGLPVFAGGYAMRMTGYAEQISIDELKQKNNPIFDMCIKDYEKYPAMVVFCISSGYGDIFDYDFELVQRENKLERTYFAYNGAEISYRGLEIDSDKCISCGKCMKKCSFIAIDKNDNLYSINKNRCDECGDCFLVCPVQAISHKGV